MINLNIQSPTGVSTTRNVAELAKRADGPITVIAHNSAYVDQWKKVLPAANVLTFADWMRNKTSGPGLIIVCEFPGEVTRKRVAIEVDAVDTQAWLVNWPTDSLPRIAARRRQQN